MKKLHIAIATNSIENSVVDYSSRLGQAPCSYVENEYALWRTASLNFSVRQVESVPEQVVRHLGWEDAAASTFTEEVDVNGILWERFSAQDQANEINELWPEANYCPDDTYRD